MSVSQSHIVDHDDGPKLTLTDYDVNHDEGDEGEWREWVTKRSTHIGWRCGKGYFTR